MWQVPKVERKDLLLQKVGHEQFEVIYGRNKDDLLERRRKPQITVPEPFQLSGNRGNKLRRAFIASILQEEEDELKIAETHKFVGKAIPGSTYANKYEQMKEREDLKKEYWNVKRGLIRRRV